MSEYTFKTPIMIIKIDLLLSLGKFYIFNQGACRSANGDLGKYYIPHPNVADLRECRHTCEHDSSCLAYEWMQKLKTCEIHIKRVQYANGINRTQCYILKGI